MKEKYIFDDFKSYKSNHNKYYEIGYMKVNKYGDDECRIISSIKENSRGNQ